MPFPIYVEMNMSGNSQSIPMSMSESGNTQIPMGTGVTIQPLPNITIGEVTTLDTGEDATATMTGDARNPVLNLGLPRGENGEDYILTNQDRADIAEIVETDLDIPNTYATKDELAGKQDIISDLAAIRSGAERGATAVQSETDPTVPAWAKAENKPTYTASEVGALPDSTTIPTKTSDLANDSHYLHGNTRGLFYGVSTTSASTGEKAVTCSEFKSSDRVTGAMVYVMIGHTNTADVGSLKLNVNSTGARAIRMMQNGSLVNLPSKDYLQLAMVYPFYFDGEYWVCLQNHFPVNVSELTNDAGYLTSAPVNSVNSKTGAVVLSASDVNALPSNTPIHNVPSGGTNGQVLTKSSNDDYALTWSTPSGSVSSVNGQTGAVVLDADDVGALPDDTVIPSNTSDLVNDSGFLTSAVTSFNGSTGAVTYTAPVASVNGKTGTVSLVPSDIGAEPTISDLSTIRSGAALGATALQSESDPTVPAWAKAVSKPTYTASEVGALPDTTAIPSQTSDLVNDSGFLTLATLPIYNGGVS